MSKDQMKALDEGRLVKHGAFTRSVLVYGIPLQKHCPFRAECDCPDSPDSPCGVLTTRSVERQLDLEGRGLSPESASQVVRLEAQLVQLYHYVAEHGMVKVEDGVVNPQPCLKHLGLIENSMSRILRDTGQTKSKGTQVPTLEEYIAAKRAQEAEEAEDAEG